MSLPGQKENEPLQPSNPTWVPLEGLAFIGPTRHVPLFYSCKLPCNLPCNLPYDLPCKFCDLYLGFCSMLFFPICSMLFFMFAVCYFSHMFHAIFYVCSMLFFMFAVCYFSHTCTFPACYFFLYLYFPNMLSVKREIRKLSDSYHSGTVHTKRMVEMCFPGNSLSSR